MVPAIRTRTAASSRALCNNPPQLLLTLRPIHRRTLRPTLLQTHPLTHQPIRQPILRRILRPTLLQTHPLTHQRTLRPIPQPILQPTPQRILRPTRQLPYRSIANSRPPAQPAANSVLVLPRRSAPCSTPSRLD